jgi:hypothetical protein
MNSTRYLLVFFLRIHLLIFGTAAFPIYQFLTFILKSVPLVSFNSECSVVTFLLHLSTANKIRYTQFVINNT